MNIAALLIGVITFILGVIFMVKAVRMPEKYARENLHERRVVTGKDCVREEMKFFQEEILIHNLEMDKDIHIPYAYITRIYLLEDMLVFMMDQNVEEIMKRDIPEEDAFIPWFLSKCSTARIRNAM